MLISQTDTAGTLYFLPDAQGSTRALTDTNGAIGQTYDYDAFGNLQGEYTSLDTNYLYTGQQFDVISELYSLRARYYDASIGRFLSRDTWAYDYQNPVELNRYVYVGNNPVTMYDPTGYTGFFGYAKATAIGAVAGGAIGGFAGGITAIGLWHLSTSGACGAKQQAYFSDNNIQFNDFVMTGFLNGLGFGVVSGATLGLASVFGMGALVSTSMLWGEIGLDLATQQVEIDPNNCNVAMLIGAGVLTLYGVLRSASPRTPTGSQDTSERVNISVEIEEVPLGSNSSRLPPDFKYVGPSGNGQCSGFCRSFIQQLVDERISFKVWSAEGRTPPTPTSPNSRYALYMLDEGLIADLGHSGSPARHWFVEVDGIVYDNFSLPNVAGTKPPLPVDFYRAALSSETFNRSAGYNMVTFEPVFEYTSATNLSYEAILAKLGLGQ